MAHAWALWPIRGTAIPPRDISFRILGSVSSQVYVSVKRLRSDARSQRAQEILFVIPTSFWKRSSRRLFSVSTSTELRYNFLAIGTVCRTGVACIHENIYVDGINRGPEDYGHCSKTSRMGSMIGSSFPPVSGREFLTIRGRQSSIYWVPM